jgi:DNA helicase-2/ATP-dependent DNA helicase PcrA
MFAEHTKSAGPRIDIRTIDSVIAHIASVYHAGLGLPPDTAAWVRQQGEDGYAELAVRVARLLTCHPMIAASLAARHRVVVCDEHQDSSGDQHAVAMALLTQNAKVRVFGDPMQRIFRNKSALGSRPAYDWRDLARRAQAFERLDKPHRWVTGCPDLGEWVLKAREALATPGGQIDLRAEVPSSVRIVFAENQAARKFDYRLLKDVRRPVDTFEQSHTSLLVLTRYNDTARSLRSFFNRRIALWEGHTRPALEKLVDTVTSSVGDPGALAAAVVRFLGDVGIGFTPSAFGNDLETEVREGCAAKRSGKRAVVQELARLLVAEPDHRGVAKTLRRIAELKEKDQRFAGIETDCRKEFWDAVRLGDFENTDRGLAEITNRRTYSRPKPPEKSISIIHKAKGLECESVIVLPCDASTFPDKLDARCLLYVALSRARSHLMLVVSRDSPSPLFLV